MTPEQVKQVEERIAREEAEYAATGTTRDARHLDAILTVLRKHGVTDFRGHGIDVRMAVKPAERPAQKPVDAVVVDGRAYVPAHVDPDKPQPDKVVEHQQIDVEAALFGAK